MKELDLDGMGYAAKYGVSDFYDEPEQKLREAIASGEDFDTGWFGARKEINYARVHREHGELEVEVSAHMDDLFDGPDLIYDALWEVARSEAELPEDIIDSIIDTAIDCEIDDKTECNVFLPANASYEDVCKALDECETSAMETNNEMYERLKEIVKEHWDHMKEREGEK